MPQDMPHSLVIRQVKMVFKSHDFSCVSCKYQELVFFFVPLVGLFEFSRPILVLHTLMQPSSVKRKKKLIINVEANFHPKNLHYEFISNVT